MDREQIINVAAGLFKERGYHATTVRAIADRLGVTSAALYYHFPSKEDILYEIFDRTMTTVEQNLEQAVLEDLTPDERLASLIKLHVMAVHHDLPFMSVFFNEVGHLSPTRYAAAHQRIRDYQRKLVGVFREAASAGLIETPRIEIAVLGILGMCNWLYRWYDPEGPFTPEQVAEFFTHLALNGIRARVHEQEPVRGRSVGTPRSGDGWLS